MCLALTDNLGSKSSHGALSEVLMIVLGDVDLLLDLIELLHRDLTSGLEPICDLQRMQSLVK